MTGVVLAQEGVGRIEGRVVREDGTAIGGVSVVLLETSASEITGSNGTFSFSGIHAGTYSITLNLGENVLTITGVNVVVGETTTVEEVTTEQLVGVLVHDLVDVRGHNAERVDHGLW